MSNNSNQKLAVKIVHSYWSKPINEKGNSRAEDRKLGGWRTKKFHYMSWALSCLSFKEYYGQIDLVTDELGKSILLDEIGLPYSNVIVRLNELDDCNLDLWALAKLYAYLLQDKPFIHVDGDVFIWKGLEEVNEAPLIVQNEEIGINFYRGIWNEILEKFSYVPEYMLKDYRNYPEIRSCNAGIFGGSDLEFIKEFAYESIEFLRRNNDSINRINTLGWSVLIYEQYLFSCLARYKEKKVYSIFPANEKYSDISSFYGVPRKKQYVHAVGSMKQEHSVCENLASQLLLRYPKYYYQIEALLQNQIL